MMRYNPEIHKRRSIRLKGYDYSQAGLYFITMCVQDREMLFGKIENNEMILNDAGKMIQTEWENLPQRFSNIELHEYVVMPNHFHGILEIVAPTDTVPENDTGQQPVGATLVVAPEPGVQNETGAKNDVIILNEPGVYNDAVAANDMVTKNETGVKNDAGRPQTGATTDGVTTDRAPTRGAPTVNEPGVINETVANTNAPMDKTVGDMMAAFKSITTVEYIRGVKDAGWQRFNGKLWQRNYYEHIIRNERSYEIISGYITDNPVRWQDDKFYSI